MASTIEIDGKHIGPGYPTYIIAEIGINHNGSEKQAFSLIDAAIKAKADAVKFQKRDLPSLYTDEVLEHPERYEQYFQYMIPLLKKVELEADSFRRLKEYCEQRGITFICTPFDKKSASFLADLGLAAFKIASADLTNLPLIEDVAEYQRPIILSTGMSTREEIEQSVDLLNAKQARFSLLHCRSVYPVWPREVNLGMINNLRQFGVPVGYSGHEIGITIALVAASMGADIIEKHLTLDRKQQGPDHKVSLEPYEFQRMVRDIRVADQAIGRTKRIMLRGEVLNRELFGKSLVAARDLSVGELIDNSAITVKGPGKGLSPNRKNELVGKTASRAIPCNSYFIEEDIEPPQDHDFSAAFTGEWGLIVRFSDYQQFLKYRPRVLEFHLAEKDFSLLFEPTEPLDCKLIVHAPEYLGEQLFDLCSASDKIRNASLDQLHRTIELSLTISAYFNGTPKLVVHPGAMSLQAKLDKQRLRDTLLASHRVITSAWRNEPVQLLYENLPPYPWYFGGQWKGNYFMSSEDIIDFAKETGEQICFDLSHAALYCNAKQIDLKEMISAVLPYTAHLHLADGYGLDGEGVQFGEGDIDLKNILPLFEGFHGSWVPEVWRGHLEQGRGFLQAVRYLQDFKL